MVIILKLKFILFLLISFILVSCSNDNGDINSIKNDSFTSSQNNKKLMILYINWFVNLRNEPFGDVSAAYLNRGDRVRVVEVDESGIWYKVRNSNKEGWVLDEYLSKSLEDVNSEELNNDFYTNEYKRLDYRSKEKRDYTSNPKIDARGVYMFSGEFLSNDLYDYIEEMKQSSINSIVINVKNDSGRILFGSDSAHMYTPSANERAYTSKDEVKKLVDYLHSQGIYVVGRIVAFKGDYFVSDNPDSAIKLDNKNFVYSSTNYISPYCRDNWNYLVGLSKEAADLGFNEIQYDYVRFPDNVKLAFNYIDGEKSGRITYKKDVPNESKTEAIQRFLQYAYDELSIKETYVSAAVFAYIGKVNNDQNLGQYFEAISNVVDYISPMNYPDHWGNGSYGLENPAKQPYELFNLYLADIERRNNQLATPAQIRMYIIDNYYHDYSTVDKQILALYHNGYFSYYIWNGVSRFGVNKYSWGKIYKPNDSEVWNPLNTQ